MRISRIDGAQIDQQKAEKLLKALSYTKGSSLSLYDFDGEVEMMRFVSEGGELLLSLRNEDGELRPAKRSAERKLVVDLFHYNENRVEFTTR